MMRLPQGLRDQPAQVYLGTLAAIAGLSYLLGIAESTTITRVLDAGWLRIWGGFLFVSGALVIWSTWTSTKALERMSLRFLSLGLLVYMGWILAAVPLARATLTVATIMALVGYTEIRVAVIKALLRPLPRMSWEEGEVQ